MGKKRSKIQKYQKKIRHEDQSGGGFKKNPFYEEGIKQLLDSQKQNCYITHCFEENNDKHTVTWNQN